MSLLPAWRSALVVLGDGDVGITVVIPDTLS